MIPKYLAVLADFNSDCEVCRGLMIGFFFFFYKSALHLSGLSSIDQLDSHFSSLCWSVCKISRSEGDSIVKLNLVCILSGTPCIRMIGNETGHLLKFVKLVYTIYQHE